MRRGFRQTYGWFIIIRTKRNKKTEISRRAEETSAMLKYESYYDFKLDRFEDYFCDGPTFCHPPVTSLLIINFYSHAISPNNFNLWLRLR